MTSLYDESNNQKRQLEEKHQKLVEELRDKSSFAADLDNKVVFIMNYIFWPFRAVVPNILGGLCTREPAPQYPLTQMCNLEK